MAIHHLKPFGRTSVPATRGSNDVSDFQNELGSVFEDFLGSGSFPALFGRTALKARGGPDFTPAIDVKETEKSYQIIADIPGIDSKDVDVTVADGYITIQGEKKVGNTEEKEGYFRQERSYGTFQRTITMPESANLDEAEANVKDGVLTVNVPKKVESQSRRRTLEIKNST